jgi:hypothetical protein
LLALVISADCGEVSGLDAEPVLTVALEGPDTSLNSFVAAVSALNSLLTALGAEVAPNSYLAWDIQALDAGSAVTAVRGRVLSGDPAGPKRVAAAFEAIGDALTRQAPVPYSPAVARHATALTEVLADHVTAIRLETPERDFTITPGHAPQGAPAAPPIISFGGVEGRIQTLSNRRSVRFTLYDELDDHAVSCYLRPGEESMIQKFWGLRALVEGTVRRDSSGRPTTIRDITEVTLLPERAPDEWLSLRGAWAEAWDGTPAEDTIRKIRDAW